eukprot:834666-Pyramimonas_sp.AAC.1
MPISQVHSASRTRSPHDASTRTFVGISNATRRSQKSLSMASLKEPYQSSPTLLSSGEASWLAYRPTKE